MADVFTKEHRSEIMSRIRSKDTKPERVVRLMLHAMGYRFRIHRKDLPGNPDIVLPKYRTVVFVHGCFWHGHTCPRGKRPDSQQEFWDDKIDKNMRRDRQAVRKLRAQGWHVLTVWECQTRRLDSLSKRLERIQHYGDDS